MNKVLLYIPALALLAAACQKENSIPTLAVRNDEPATEKVEMITETVSAGLGAGTKATIDANAKFAWTAGDNVAVHISNGQYVFTSDPGASGASPKAAPDVDKATFTVVYEEGYVRDAYVIFPSTLVAKDAANYGQTGQTLDLTLPGSYTLDQLTGTKTPCPMISANTPGLQWEFRQLCGLLRLTVNSIPPTTKRLEIDFNGKKVWGDFSVAIQSPLSDSVIATAADADHDVIKIFKEGTDVDVTLNDNKWLDDLVLNIPLPTGDYTQITVTAYNALSGGDAVLTMTRQFEYTASNQYGTMRTYTFPVISISSSTRVVFSPGNLVKTDNTYAVGSGNESYEFESVPFNTNGGSLGYAQGTPSSTSARGYFTWSEATFFANSLTISGISGWRALSYGEWNHVMAGNGVGRTMKNGIYRWFLVKGTNGKCGLLLPPDCATTSDVEGLNSSVASVNPPVNTNVDIDSYVDKGFVFLPSEGCRYGLYWSYTNDEGYYWSTTSADSSNGYSWTWDIITTQVINSYATRPKTDYSSIRLVRVIN